MRGRMCEDTPLVRRCGALLLIAIGWGCGRVPPAPEKEPPPPVEVRTAPAVAGPVRRTLPVTGTLAGDEEATVSAKVTGRIAELFADLGDRVRDGAPLARVDTTDLELERVQRAKVLEERLAALGLAGLPGSDFDPEKLLDVVRARLRADLAKSLHENATNLGEFVSREEADRLRSQWEVAEQERLLAVQEARAKLAAARTARALLDIAEQRLRDTLHTAPLRPRNGAEGTDRPPYAVAARLVAIGDQVEPGTPLFRLVADDPLRLRASVPERRAAAMRQDASVSVRVDGVDREVTGRLARLSPVIDRETRTLLVEILMPNAARDLRPGGFARAEIDLGEETAVLVPRAALSTFAGIEKVFVSREGKAEERRVRVGQASGDRIEIVEGVRAGDLCILDPPASLFGGSAVREAAGAPPR